MPGVGQVSSLDFAAGQLSQMAGHLLELQAAVQLEGSQTDHLCIVNLLSLDHQDADPPLLVRPRRTETQSDHCAKQSQRDNA